MTQQEVWDFLASLKVGTIVSIILVAVAIVTAIALGIKKLYKWFSAYHSHKTTKAKTAERLKRHDEALDRIEQNQASLNNLMIQMIRSNIIVICQNAIAAGKITDVQLRELTELYELYESKGGNSYASLLMDKVVKLPIVYLMDGESK